MNRQNAKDYLPHVVTLAEGKTLQAHRLQIAEDGSESREWEDFGPDEEVLFTCPPHLYRAKP